MVKQLEGYNHRIVAFSLLFFRIENIGRLIRITENKIKSDPINCHKPKPSLYKKTLNSVATTGSTVAMIAALLLSIFSSPFVYNRYASTVGNNPNPIP